MFPSSSGFWGKHSEADDPVSAVIGEEIVRAAQNGRIWLNTFGELCSTPVADIAPERHRTKDLVQGFESLQDFFHVGIAICHNMHALNQRGVFLRITCVTHWDLSVAQTYTDLEPGMPVLCEMPFAVHTGEVKSIAFDQDDILSRHLPNVPPELIREAAAVKFPVACDVYSLAATLYHLLTGHPCLDVDTSQYTSRSVQLLERAHAALAVAPLPPSTYRKSIPPELDAILLKALSKVPTQRYLSCRSLAKDLEKLQASLADPTRPHISVGAVDELLRLEPPHTHYGRGEAEETLRKALARAVRGKSALVVLSGSSGTGKTVTAETLIPEVSRAGGLWISVKAQLQSNRSMSVLSGVANSLLRPLLLISGVDIAQWQREVLQSVGRAAMSILSPWIDADLRLPFAFSAPEVEEDAANPLKRMAAEGAVVRLVTFVLRHLKPVVIFIDDCQWLQGPDITFVESLLAAVPQGAPGLFVLCAQRPIDEKDSAQAAFRLSSISHTLASCPKLIHLGSLASDVIFSMLRDLLGPRSGEGTDATPTPRRVDELQQIVSLMTDASAPTPMFCRQVLLTMRDRRILTFDWDTERWQFHEDAATAVAPDLHSADSATFLLHNVLRRFSQQAQTMLVAAATISGVGPFTTKTVAAVAGLDEVTILPMLVQAVQRRILSTVNNEFGVSDTKEDAMVIDEIAYVFTHDQWIEASYALCPPADRAELHLRQARRLAHLSEHYATLVAANIKLARDNGLRFAREEMDKFRPVMMHAARSELERRKTENAIAYLEVASVFLGDKHVLAEFQDVHQSLFDAYFSATRTREAAEVADKLQAHARTDVDRLHAASMQLRCLAILDPRQGIEYCCDILLRYEGIDVKETAKTIALRKQFLPGGPEPFMPNGQPSELNLVVQRIMGENITLFYPMDAEIGMSLIWNMILYAQRTSPTPYTGYALGCMSLFCTEVMNFDFARKYAAIGEYWVSHQRATPYQEVDFQFARDAAIHFTKRTWTEAGREYLGTAHRAYELAMYEVATYCMAHTSTILFWSGAHLQEIVDVGHHLAPQCRHKTGAGWAFGAVGAQVAHNLLNSSEDHDPLMIEGVFEASGAYEQVSRSIQMHELHWTCYQFALNLIFRRPIWPMYVKRRFAHWGSGNLIQTVISTYVATLGIFEGMSSGEDIQDVDREFAAKTMKNFEKWAAQTETTKQYTAMLSLLKAAELVANGIASFDDVLRAYDEAIDAAQAVDIHILEAVESEAVAAYILKQQPHRRRMADGYILNCYRAYERWGAHAKCIVLNKEFPHLRLMIPSSTSRSIPPPLAQAIFSDTNSGSSPLPTSEPQQNGRSSSTNQSKSTHSNEEQVSLSTVSRDRTSSKGVEAAALDVASLLAAAHSWQMEGTVERMTFSILRVLFQNTGSSYGCMAIKDERGLRLRAAGSTEALQSDLDLALEDAANMAPIAILEYVERTGQTATSALLSITSLQDNFILKRRPASIVALPIMLQSKVAGILYLDSPIPSAFSASDLSIISSLSTQALLALERTTYSRLLELKVEERTAELSQRNKELELARKAAEDAKEAENRFLLRMSHELRTPANSVIVLADLLQEAPLNGLYREYVSQIKASSEQLRGIIHDILDWSKLSSQEMVAESIPFNLRDCIETAIQTLAEQASSKGLELCYSTPTSNDLNTMVIGDEFRCKQILLNLISNAVRFTSAPGFVSVTSSYEPFDGNDAIDELLVRISVQDSGIGVPKSKHHTLFKSFSQVDESITRLYGGSGLGLAISRSLARLLGGDAWIDPTSGDGAGSKFWFSFVVKCGQPLPPLPILAPRLKGQARALIWAPPLVTTDVLVANLSMLGLKCQIVDTYTTLSASYATESMNIIIADMLQASDEEQSQLQNLIKLPNFQGLVFIGSSQTAMQLLSLDSRISFLMRPARAHSLNDAVLSLLDKSAPRFSAPLTRKTSTLPKLKKDYPVTILAVDDNDVNRLVFKRVLERLGYTTSDITLEADGQRAVSACKIRQFDLILMDSEMPVMDGTTAMRSIREEHGEKAPYMVVVTAAAMPGDRERFIQAGFNAYLSKPLVLPALAEAIKSAYVVKHGPPNVEMDS